MSKAPQAPTNEVLLDQNLSRSPCVFLCPLYSILQAETSSSFAKSGVCFFFFFFFFVILYVPPALVTASPGSLASLSPQELVRVVV